MICKCNEPYKQRDTSRDNKGNSGAATFFRGSKTDCAASDLVAATSKLESCLPIHKVMLTTQRMTSADNASEIATADRIKGITLILMLNVRGLLQLRNRTNMPFLGVLVASIALTDTHLKQDIENAEIHVLKYGVLGTHRKEGTHGGVAIYICENLTLRVLLSH